MNYCDDVFVVSASPMDSWAFCHWPMRMRRRRWHDAEAVDVVDIVDVAVAVAGAVDIVAVVAAAGIVAVDLDAVAVVVDDMFAVTSAHHSLPD